MLYFYFKIITLLVFSCTLFVLVATAAGSTRPHPSALDDFIEGCDDQTRPCWQGIVPGVTTVDELRPPLSDIILRVTATDTVAANTIPIPVTYHFMHSEVPSLCPASIEVIGEVVFAIMLEFCEPVQLGDLALIAGMPTRVYGSVGSFRMTPNPIAPIPRDLRDVIYGAHHQRYSLWSPHDRLSTVYLRSTQDVSERWHGFVPAWRYCQLEPDSWSCR